MSTKNSMLRKAVIFVVGLSLLVAAGNLAGRTVAAPTAVPAVVTSVIQPPCPSSITAGANYTKIGDLGTFEVQSGESVVELTFYGRIYAASTNGPGVVYEMRVDDAPSSIGRIRAVLRSTEIGLGHGSSVAMGGFFEGLTPGTHTVSMWADVGGGGTSATTVMYDPGCWSSDHVVLKEYLPFGSVALPTVLRP